jgi:putative nucleotidyltransferase with HDIG domain
MTETTRWESLKEKLANFFAGRFFLLLATVIALVGVMTPQISVNIDYATYQPGAVAKRTVRAPKDYQFEDTETTSIRREEARTSVSKVFVIQEINQSEIAASINEFFNDLKELSSVKNEDDAHLLLGKDEKVNIERKHGIDLVGREWDLLLSTESWLKLRDSVLGLVSPIMKRGIIASKIPLNKALEEGNAVLIRKSTGKEENLKSVEAFYDIAEALEIFKASFPTNGFGKGPDFDSLVSKVSLSLIKPNVVFDNIETERRLLEAEQSVRPVYFNIRRGEVIVRGGDIVSETQFGKVKRISQIRNSGENFWRTIIGNTLLSTLIIAACVGFILIFWPGFDPSGRDLIVMSLTLVGSFVLLEMFNIVGDALSYAYTSLVPDTFILAAPLAAGGLLLQVSLGAAGVVAFVLTFGLLFGVYFDANWLTLILFVTGNIVGALCIKKCAKRSAYLIAGARISLINIFVVSTFYLLAPDQGLSETATKVLWAIVGGLLSGGFGAFLTPIAEIIGGYVTDIKLLELASLDHPLLKELSLQAPGTWNHSMVMGQIGEAAAEAIGANALLTRVGAYYHDIGKTKKPIYFVENQARQENRHEKLTPSMSALIIKAHVKDGIEMAKSHHLPQTIIDFIPEHHGTSLIEYFYDKATKEAEEDDESVDINLYRYPGPKPQSKETGILMLADGVEAASRTLSDPTPAKIQGLVQKMINKVFVSGELEESSLTLKDLHLIAKSFTRVLSGILHRRIEYSEPAEKVREKEDKDTERSSAEVAKDSATGAKSDASRHTGETPNGKASGEAVSKKPHSKNGKDAIKRLGIS